MEHFDGFEKILVCLHEAGNFDCKMWHILYEV